MEEGIFLDFKQSLQTKQAQQQKQVQKLAMTQQLKQSIQILSYTNDELQKFIENKALENPFLELNWNEHNYENNKASNMDISDQVQSYLEQLPNTYESLYSALEEQIYLNYRKTPIRKLMFELLNYLDDNGYLTVELDQLVTTDKPLVMWIDALTLLQQLEPAGIGARNLQECLLLQIERDNNSPNLAYIIIEEDFLAFTEHKWEQIEQKYNISLGEIQKIADYLLTLTPHPGNIFNSTLDQSIIPELSLRKENDELFLTLNKYGQPQVTFESSYYNEIKTLGDKDAKSFAYAKKNEYDWISKSLKQRQETIYNVGLALINYQKDFFLLDTHPLKPLSLHDLAKELDVHESTISRTVNGKYIETWFGIFELKSLFVKRLANNSADVSTQEIKDALKIIVNNEDKQKPYSDQKLVEELDKKGYKLSRRTVAKYRDELGIPSSTRRKRYF